MDQFLKFTFQIKICCKVVVGFNDLLEFLQESIVQELSGRGFESSINNHWMIHSNNQKKSVEQFQAACEIDNGASCNSRKSTTLSNSIYVRLEYEKIDDTELTHSN